MDFNSQLVVIAGVGRSGQMGEALALSFARQGATLALIDRNSSEAEQRAADIVTAGYTASAHSADLTDAAALAAVVSEIHNVHARFEGKVHAVVCVAGGYAGGTTVDETEESQWHRMFSVNVETAYQTTRAFLPSVRNARGAFVYFTSVTATASGNAKGLSAYAAAKSAVLTFMKAVAADEKQIGVRANAVAPTSIRTAANEHAMGVSKNYVEKESVADVVLFLSSQQARNVSGQVITLS